MSLLLSLVGCVVWIIG
ncbi:hypothetical protein CFP56_023483 [Quercus suber]|uniref:Uncharacterized protein n=1 Tax=Quercus suber TaxID=58331 RepID=A0AAW0K974_QUESU